MLVNDKSILARLMATENLVVEQRAVETASFNLKTRVLTIPIMKEGISEDVLDLMIGHEISHGLETPLEGWHHSVVDLKIHRGILNICEDARIEKKLKRRYPGVKGPMHRGYKTLMDMNFFGTEGKDINNLNVADRINLHCKLGSLVNIRFTEDEGVHLDAIEAAETFEETIAAARGLQKYMEETNTEMGDEDENGDVKYILDPNGNMCPTDSAFRDREKELYDENACDNQYATIPTINLDAVIFPFDLLMRKLNAGGFIRGKSVAYAAFLRDSNKVVSYLVKEFEMKKNAKQFVRNREATSGSLDMKKIHSYQTREDLFKQITISDNGKNHGMVAFVDWSGSMVPHIKDTIEQVLNLTLFCKKVGIPFEVYAFTNAEMGSLGSTLNRSGRHSSTNVDDLLVPPFHLLNLFSSKMTAAEFSSMASYILRFRSNMSEGENPSWLQLSGTPLNEAIVAAMQIGEKFKASNRLDILSMIFITDGEGTNLYKKHASGTRHESITPSKRARAYIRDNKTKLCLELKPGVNMTKPLLEMLAVRAKCTTVGFFIAPHRNIKSTIQASGGTEEMVDEFRKKHYLAMKDTGYEEYYLIKSTRTEEFDMDFMPTATTAKGIASEFTEHNVGKLSHRVILSRFITIIS